MVSVELNSSGLDVIASESMTLVSMALGLQPVGVTVCVKPPLRRRSSQCDRSSGPKMFIVLQKSVVGVCEVSGKDRRGSKQGQERHDTWMTIIFKDTKMRNP